jgi:hypothetical protein
MSIRYFFLSIIVRTYNVKETTFTTKVKKNTIKIKTKIRDKTMESKAQNHPKKK